MSRAREIQEKLNLQAKIQSSLSNQSSKVLAWLNDDDDDMKLPDADELKESQNEFFKLPVMQLGSGLNMDEEIPGSSSSTSNEQHDIHTVGEFIKSDKKISSLAKKKQWKQKEPFERRNNTNNNIHRITKDDNKAMIALKRKMRNSQRSDIKKNIVDKQEQEKESSNQHSNDDSDSDSDHESRRQISKKKTVGLLFQSKNKNKSKK